MSAGSGGSTLIGGSGDSPLVGGGKGHVFTGGTGHDTLVAGGTSDVFTFASTLSGGQHVIDNFASGDKLNLQGYDSASALANAKVIGGSTVITLDHGHTTITLEGFTHLNAEAFTTH